MKLFAYIFASFISFLNKVQGRHIHNFTVYTISTSEVLFEKAQMACINQDSELVMIQTEDVQIFLRELFENNDHGNNGNEFFCCFSNIHRLKSINPTWFDF